MKAIASLFAILLLAPLSSWSQTPPSDEGRKTDADDVPLTDPATVTLYGSFRLHTNLTTVDEAAGGRDNKELGLTDAYSRVGARIDFGLGETDIVVKTELGLNLADLELGDPAFFDDEDMRV